MVKSKESYCGQPAAFTLVSTYIPEAKSVCPFQEQLLQEDSVTKLVEEQLTVKFKVTKLSQPLAVCRVKLLYYCLRYK